MSNWLTAIALRLLPEAVRCRFSASGDEVVMLTLVEIAGDAA